MPSLWDRYWNGPEGLEAFRRERIRLRDGRTLGEALVRDPWQRPILAIFDAVATLLGFIDGTRGIGKTTLTAAVAVERLVLRAAHDVFVLANDRDQARLLFREARDFISRDPALSRICTIKADEIVNEANGSRLVVLASDAVGNFGLGIRPFTAIFDEFWGQRDRGLFDALWTAVPKSPGSQILVLTNAGPDREGIAWEVREMCRTSDDPALRFWASADSGVIPSWIDPVQVERQRRTLPDSVFGRLWRGEWGHGGGDFLTPEEIEACIDEGLEVHSIGFDRRRRYYVGVDLGLKHDRSVVVVCHKERERTVVDYVWTWYGTPERPVSLEDVQAHLHMLGQRIPRLARGLLDPWQGVLMLERAKRAGLRMLEEFTFSGQNVQLLSQSLWHAFRSGNVRIPPYAPLVEELATLRIVERRYGWRIDHQAGGFSDHAMALGLALVAAIPDHGDLIVEEPGLDYVLDHYLERVQNRRLFGYQQPSGLYLTDVYGAPQREDWFACTRVLQLLLQLDRISTQEADTIKERIRAGIVRDTGWTRDPLREMRWTDDRLDERLGRVEAFLYPQVNHSLEEAS